MAEEADRSIKTLSGFIKRIEDRRSVAPSMYLYRGHDGVGHTLAPSLFRQSANRKHEKNIFRELVSMHPTEFSEDKGVFEQLVRMQHFSLPTRLLDITFNPLVALYFACRTKIDKDGEFIRISIRSNSIKYYDSDTVSCVSNLSNLSGNERDQIRKMSDDDELSGSIAGRRLLHLVKSEKPYFEPRIELQHLRGVYAVKPRQTNRRMLAQQGAFLLFGLTTELKDENEFDIEVVRSPVPASAKRKLRTALDRININDSTMFPEIESAAKYIMEKIGEGS